jgi:hypothetical protein
MSAFAVRSLLISSVASLPGALGCASTTKYAATSGTVSATYTQYVTTLEVINGTKTYFTQPPPGTSLLGLWRRQRTDTSRSSDHRRVHHSLLSQLDCAVHDLCGEDIGDCDGDDESLANAHDELDVYELDTNDLDTHEHPCFHAHASPLKLWIGAVAPSVLRGYVVRDCRVTPVQ